MSYEIQMADDNLKVFYTSDGEDDGILTLGELIANFRFAGVSEPREFCEETCRYELASRGYYDGVHESGHYLVLNYRALDLAPSGKLLDIS